MLNAVHDIWSRSVARHPDRIALSASGQRTSYREADNRVKEWTETLSQLGVSDRTRVVLLIENPVEFTTVMFASLNLKAVVCPLSITLTERELNEILALVEPALVVSDIPGKIEFCKTRRLPVVAVQHREPVFGEGVIAGALEVELEDVAFILCTSGTTGLPKAGLLTHQNIVQNVAAFGRYFSSFPGMQWLDHETFGNIVPLSGPYGLIMMLLMPLYLGGTVAFMPQFSPESCLRALQDEEVTFFGGVPGIYAAITRYRLFEQFNTERCRVWICGGAPLPSATRERFWRKYQIDIKEGFGMLETASIATLDFGDSSAHPNSVGPFSDTMRAEIRNEKGMPLVTYEEGELWVRGSNVFKGYFRNIPATEEAIQDGWLRTGDLGHLDKDGYLYLSGRIKELMIVDGHNVYPHEIESVLLEHTGVKDVAVAAPTRTERGDEITAYIVPEEGYSIVDSELAAHCRNALSRFKVPRNFLVVEAIPRNSSGKILRRALTSV